MKQNLFDQIPEKAPKELFTELLSANHVRIERIVSFGQVSPNGFWYEQVENEWILLLEGSAQLRFDDRSVDLTPGDYLNIQAGERHRVEKTATNGRTVWLAVFYK
jgi:cupin 2 domain-containing protein